MRSRFKSLCIKIAGWGFIFLGILGLFLPILQGILFLLVGLFLLSEESPWARKMLDKLKAKFPNVSRKFEEAKIKAKEVQLNIFKKKQRQEGD